LSQSNDWLAAGFKNTDARCFGTQPPGKIKSEPHLPKASVAGRRRDWLRHLLRLAVKPPPQVTGHQIDGHGREHDNHAEPNPPVAMRTSPKRRMAVINRAAIRISVRFMVVLQFIHNSDNPRVVALMDEAGNGVKPESKAK
jgi:hypothetical protein